MANQTGNQTTPDLEQALYRLYHAPQPDPAFVNRLERRLLANPPAPSPLPLVRRLLSGLAFQARLAGWAAAALLLMIGLAWGIEHLLPRQNPSALLLTPSATQLSVTGQASPTPSAPVTPASILAPGNGLLALMAPVNSLSQVFLIPAGGSTSRLVSDPARNAFSPALTMDASRLAYAIQMDSSREIVVVELSTGKINHLTQGSFDDHPFWSPDGRQIVFERLNQNNRTDLFVMDADGANLKSLLTDQAQKTLSGWSADGKSVLFSSDLRAAQGNPDLPIRLMSLDLASGSTRDLASFPTAQKTISFALSPDGSQIAYEGLDGQQPVVYLMNLDGSGAHKPGEFQPCNYSPVFSPDGKWLACSRVQNGEFNVQYISLEGQADQVVAGPVGQITSWVAPSVPFQAGPAPDVTPATPTPTATPSGPHTSDWLAFRSDELGFSILHPQSWNAVESDQSGNLYDTQSYVSADTPFSYSISITEVANPDGLDIEALMKKGLTPAEKRSVSLEKTFIGPYTAYRTTTLPIHQGALTYFISAGHRWISVSLSPYNTQKALPGQAETQALFEAMLPTFQATSRPTPAAQPANRGHQPIRLSLSPDSTTLDASQGLFYLTVRSLAAPISRQLVRVSGACLLNRDSCPAQKVTDYPVGNDSPLSWSPDGRLAILADGNQTLLLEPQTGMWKTLTARYAALDSRYRWSPDSSWLAAAVQFSGQAASEDAILLIRPDGSAEKLLAAGLEDMKYPLGWLDGDTLLVIRDHTGIKGTGRQTRPGLFKMDIRTGEWSELAPDLSLNESHPVLSDSGLYLAYQAMGAAGLTFWDLHSQQQNSLSVAGIPAVWSPNGRWIAYVLAGQKTGEVWVTHPDGAGQTRLFSGNAYPAAWAAGSQKVVLEVYPGADEPASAGVQLWLAAVDGGSLRQIILDGEQGVELLNPSWQPAAP